MLIDCCGAFWLRQTIFESPAAVLSLFEPRIDADHLEPGIALFKRKHVPFGVSQEEGAICSDWAVPSNIIIGLPISENNRHPAAAEFDVDDFFHSISRAESQLMGRKYNHHIGSGDLLVVFPVGEGRVSFFLLAPVCAVLAAGSA